MVSKKLLGLVTSAFLLFNVVGTASVKTTKANDVNTANNQATALTYDKYVNGGPYDLAVANEDKIIDMLKREGKIAKNATPDQIQKIYHQYLQDTAAAQNKMASGVTQLDKNLMAINSKKMASYNASLLSKKNGLQSSSALKTVQEQTWTGAVRKDRVMVLLIDFPDYKHNNIKPEDGPVLFYNDYTHQHYQDMIFGENGYTGPNGEKLLSVKQYYEQQSGGSYTIEGEVFGWYTAQNNAAYYGGHTQNGGNDANPRALIKEALAKAAADPELAKLGGFNYFDQEDRYDLNNNGNVREPDKMVDHLIVIHAGVGEEAGGGALGDDAIWSHRWNLGGLYKIPGTDYTAYDYTTEPEDGAAGVFAHEYGHDLGLPDEYDTIYSGAGEPIGYWSIMSSGSWGGKIGGAEPTGFSPYAKEFFQATMPGSNWQPNVTTINYSDLTTTGRNVVLDQASSHGLNNNVVKINLPDKQLLYATPFGKQAYYSGKGSDGGYESTMSTNVDLTGKTTATLKFKTLYDIEENYDFATVEVKDPATGEWVAVRGNLTSDEPNDYGILNGITGSSNNEWVDAAFDLSAYAGKRVDLRFHYLCDPAVFGFGFFVDNIVLEANGTVILSDDAEGTASRFDLTGDGKFIKSDGKSEPFKNYYLVEWRNHQGVDASLAHINRGGQLLSYDPGMVVWYVDNAFTDNWTGIHPGDGYLGVVDADQKAMTWNYTNGKTVAASNGYQVHDAAFSLRKSAPFFLDQTNSIGRTLGDNNQFMHPFFDDSRNYTNPGAPFVGRNIPKLGIKIYVTGETKDRSSASILIKK